jgi:hypothetical protein
MMGRREVKCGLVSGLSELQVSVKGGTMPIKDFLLEYIQKDIDEEIFDEDIILNDHEISREMEEYDQDMNFEDLNDSDRESNEDDIGLGNYESNNSDKTPPPFKTPSNISTILKGDSVFKMSITPTNHHSSRNQKTMKHVKERLNKSDSKEHSSDSFDN